MNPAAQPGPFASFVPLAAMILIFYFLLIRPQQKQMKEHKKMLEGLKKGDRILSNGGFYGTVITLRGPDLEVKISDNCKVLMSRQAVSRLANGPELVGNEGKKA